MDSTKETEENLKIFNVCEFFCPLLFIYRDVVVPHVLSPHKTAPIGQIVGAGQPYSGTCVGHCQGHVNVLDGRKKLRNCRKS